MYLQRAVDSDVEILDILVEKRRDRRAALKLMRKLLKQWRIPTRAVITD